MLIERSYGLGEFLWWTRRNTYVLLVLSVVPVVLHEVVGWTFLEIPFAIIFLLGTTVALSVGFKNLQTYNRMQDAQAVWTSIASTSRAWGSASRDLVVDPDIVRRLVNRHLAWLAAVRHEMRERKPWESQDKAYNVEYQHKYEVREREESLASELLRYLPPEEVAQVEVARNKPWRVLALQGADIKRLVDAGAITPAVFNEFFRWLREFADLHGKTQRIKEFPYPRQHAFINTTFVRILCVLLPFGMLSEFHRLADAMNDTTGLMIWLVVPLSLLISWMYTSLDQVSETTENPFEGGANDVPITQLCEDVELDLREALGEIGLPSAARRKGFAT
jgi:putative membrane protein